MKSYLVLVVDMSSDKKSLPTLPCKCKTQQLVGFVDQTATALYTLHVKANLALIWGDAPDDDESFLDVICQDMQNTSLQLFERTRIFMIVKWKKGHLKMYPCLITWISI